MNEILQQRIFNLAKEIVNYNLVDLGDLTNSNDLFKMLLEMGSKVLSHQWISVDEDLPKYDVAVIAVEYNPGLSWEDQKILFAHRSKNPDVWRDKNDFCIYPPTIMKITHWMETPRLEGGEK